MFKELCVALLAPWKFQSRLRLKALIVAVLFAATSVTRAEDPDEAYLTVYNLVQEGDALSAKGKNQDALDKYRAAQVSLRQFRQYHAAWKPRLIAAREKYLNDRVTALTAPGAAVASSNSNQPAGASASAAGGRTEALPAGMSIKLLNAGAEPRKALRLHPNAGDKQTCLMTVKMDMDMKVGEMSNPMMKLPGTSMTMEATVKSVSPEGDIAYESVITDATVADDPAAQPLVAEAMKGAFQKLKGLTIDVTMSNRGIKKEVHKKVPEGVDPQTQQIMEQMSDSFSKTAAPLPEEPIGAGAKWEVKMPLKSQGISLEQTSAYELVSFDGDKLVTKNSLTQRAGKQKVESADLIRLAGSGKGETTFDLTKTLPVKATMSAQSDAVMAMGSGAQKQEATIKVSLEMEIETK